MTVNLENVRWWHVASCWHVKCLALSIMSTSLALCWHRLGCMPSLSILHVDGGGAFGFQCKQHKTSFKRFKRLWKDSWSIILVSSLSSPSFLPFFSNCFQACKISIHCELYIFLIIFPGRHLHLVVVTDKSSRGEVSALLARILTR